MNPTEDVKLQFDLIENVGSSRDNVPRLHNTRQATQEIQTEKAWHRAAMYMLAAGQSQKDVAVALDKTPQAVSIVYRQAWFQEKLAEVINDAGGDELTQLLKGAAKDCIIRLIDIRDDDDTPKAVVLGTCKELLDRHLGKAPQHVDFTQNKPVGDIHEQMAETERQLNELRKRESTNTN